jgi:cobalt-zinc-cadmium efflux system outer membrane protein
VEARVEAGKEAAIQTQRIDILRTTAAIAAQKARGAYQASLAELAALLNRPPDSLRLQAGWLDQVGEMPDVAPDLESLAMNPKYALISAAIRRAQASVAVATSAAVPDPTLRAGFRRYNDNDSSALVVGLSVPIPVFDRNRGAILEAQQLLIRAEAEQEAARLEILGDLAKSRTAALTAYQQVQTLKSTVEPAANRALSAARDGYQTGKFDFLNLLDAQRTRFEIEEQLAGALEDYHLARIALTSLVGRVE